jgi:hypothetical protein
MEAKRRSSSGKRLVKPFAFVALLVLAVVLSKYMVTFDLPAMGYVPLSDSAREKVSVDFVNGAVSTILSSDEHGDVEQFKTEYTQWKVTNGVIVQPQTSNVQGCSTEYVNNLEVNFSISNQLTFPERGTVNVTVFDNRNGAKLATKLFIMDFKPGTMTSGVAKFTIFSNEFDPLFLVKVTFPTSDELSFTPATSRQVPLLEYVLMKLGIISPG